MTNNPKPIRKRLIASIGLIIGLIALTAAFLSPNIAEMIDPPKQQVEEVAVDLASRIIDAAKAKATGEDYEPKGILQPRPSRFIYPTVIGLSMLAVALGIISLIRSEDNTLAGGAIALGIGAAVVQWSMMIAGAIILILLVIVILGFLGGSI